MFVDERLDNAQPTKSPIEEALNITRTEKGDRHISFNYGKVSLELAILRQISNFKLPAQIQKDDNQISIHHGMLINNGTTIEGLVVHNFRYMNNSNPIISEGHVRKYGKFDLAYLFNEKGDVLISGYSNQYADKNQSQLD